MTFELTIPAKNIHPNPDNPRTDPGDVTELRRSIEVMGILQSVLVSPNALFESGHYMLEAGERRWTAASLIDPDYPVPARLYSPSIHDNPTIRALKVGIIENLHRQELKPMEKARAFERLRLEGPMNQNEIAKTLGLNPGTISRYLGLLVLAPKMQKAIEDGRMTVEEGTGLVKRLRAKQRKDRGYKPTDVGWEPDHFTDKHFLARKARVICDARDHNNRRRLGGVACGQCWEDAVRRDEDSVQSAAFRDMGFDVPFQSPVMNAVGNSIGQGSNR